MTRIKVLGERNTGTNFLHQLLDLNLIGVEVGPGVNSRLVGKISRFFGDKKKEEIVDNHFKRKNDKFSMWKHAYIPNNHFGKEFYTVSITKNPYSWYLSMKKNPYHFYDFPSDPSAFLNHEFDLVKREGISTKMKLIEIWNAKNESYRLCGEPSHVTNIKYEDLVIDPESVISKVAHTFNLNLKEEFDNVSRSTKNSTQTFKDYKQYYGQSLWKSKLNDEEISIISSQVDKKLMSFFNYNVL